ncbi:unnamed protein product [Parajaminaea phylloscopi]
MSSTTQRVTQLAGHLDPRTWSGKGLPAAKVKGDNDVVIVAAGRTAQCKAKKGHLKDTPFDVLCYELFKAILAQVDFDPKLIDDVVVGNVANANAAYVVRAAALAAGIPDTTPSLIVNRFCSSGLMAIRTVANQIQAGEIDCGLAAGIESMNQHAKREILVSDDVAAQSQQAADCRMPMGWTSENVAGDFGITRQEMDAFASRSHARASHAQKAGQFKDEILPIQATVVHEDGSKSYEVVTEDDGIRHNTTPEGLAKIKPAFPQWSPGQTTGGNASQLTDGGAATILMRRSLANKLGLKVIAKYVGCAVAGLEPRIMGIGPTKAIPKVLEQTGIRPEEVDLFEINEAFASMAVYCQRKLEIPDDRINVYGGAIALGHPLGCSGARLVVTLLNALKRREAKVGVVSACVGLGMGVAGVFIRED